MSQYLILKVNQNSTFKYQDWYLQSNQIGENRRRQVKQDDVFLILSIQSFEKGKTIDNQTGEDLGDYWEVKFTKPLPSDQGTAYDTWYVYRQHVEELQGTTIRKN